MHSIRRAAWGSCSRLTPGHSVKILPLPQTAPSLQTTRQIHVAPCKAVTADPTVNVFEGLVQQVKTSIKTFASGGTTPPPSSKAAQPDASSTATPNSAPTDSAVLLVLIPGSDTVQGAMPALADAVSQVNFGSTTGRMLQRIWVATTPGLDVQKATTWLEGLDESSPASGRPAPPPAATAAPQTPSAQAMQLLEATIEAAVQQSSGFPCHKAPSGRYQNVVVLLAGDAGPLFADAAYKRAGACVMLHSAWSGTQGSTHGGWSTYSRPMMVVAARTQLADQQVCTDAAVCAFTAARQGAEYAATRRSFLLSSPLDGRPAPDHADLARSLAAFTMLAPKAYGPGIDPELQAAAQYLETQVQSSLTEMQPFAQGINSTDLLAAWRLGQQLDTPGTKPSGGTKGAHVVVGSNGAGLGRPVPLMANVGMLGSAVGGGMSTNSCLKATIWDSGPASHSVPVVPSGVVDQAEEELARMQVVLAEAAVAAGWLPDWVLSRLRVVVNVHSTLTGMAFCTATVRPCKGGEVEVQIQAFLHWPSLDDVPPVKEESQAPLTSRCPSYWAKMKGAVGLAAEVRHHLGLAALPVEPYRQGVQVDTRTFNQMALDWALEHIPEDARIKYEQEGVQLQCGPDISISAPYMWLHLRMKYERQSSPDTTKLIVQASSPTIDSGLALGHGVVCEKMPEDPEVRGVWAVMYLKAMSRAQALDWVLSGAFKQAALKDSDVPICWGGATPAGMSLGPAKGPPPRNAVNT